MGYDLQLAIIFGSALLSIVLSLTATLVRNHYRNRKNGGPPA